MGEDFFLNVFSNNGLAAAGFFYVLFRINPTLQKLTEAINNLCDEHNKRLDKIEERERDTQSQIKELQSQINYLKKGDFNERR